jgi:hypothetical protein
MELTAREVVEIAKVACAERKIDWREPYTVKRGWRNWTVLMPSNVRGGNAVIYVSKKTGQPKVRFYNR